MTYKTELSGLLCAVGRALAAVGLLHASLGAHAAWPEKPLRLIVPFAAGGTTDLVARALSDPLARALGQSVVVENKPGASGMVGTELVAKASPDGYTLLFSTSVPLSIEPARTNNRAYDPVLAFTHVSLLGATPILIGANPKTGPSSFANLLKSAGSSSYGTSGDGSLGHIVGQLLERQVQGSLSHVPYRGPSPMHSDLQAGRIPIGLDLASGLDAAIRSGSVIGLAVTSLTRHPQMPDIPSVGELGFPQLAFEVFYGISAPAGLNREIVDKLADAISTATDAPAVKRLFDERGIVLRKLTAELFSDFVRSQVIAMRRTTQTEPTQAQIKEYRVSLKSRSAENAANAPASISDPGYPIADCVRPQLPEDKFTINVAIGIGDNMDGWGTNFICGNSVIGKQIIERRKWYCKPTPGYYEGCVLGKWEGGEPAFWPIVSAERRVMMTVQGLGRIDVQYRPFELR